MGAELSRRMEHLLSIKKERKKLLVKPRERRKLASRGSSRRPLNLKGGNHLRTWLPRSIVGKKKKTKQRKSARKACPLWPPSTENLGNFIREKCMQCSEGRLRNEGLVSTCLEGET